MRPNNYKWNKDTDELTPCADVIEWGCWFEKADRRVAEDVVDDARISTVFLGLDHNYTESGAPLLFETVIFGGVNDGYQERYCTPAAARLQHERIVNQVRNGMVYLDR